MLISPGDEIDRFRVVRALGQGGIAEVYMVEHQTLGTHHALKVLLHASGPIRERLIQEGRVQAHLKHPNLVAVTDVLEVDGAPGLLMEYVDGPSLYTWLRTHRPTLEGAEQIFRGVLAGVRYAHDAGFIHRDLKPDNVLMATIDGQIIPKVADFGLAKALEDDSPSNRKTRTGVAMGTPAYMAPEQFRDAKSVDKRADLFALGCILYELVCGQRAFEGSNMMDAMMAITKGDYTSPQNLAPEMPERFGTVISACLTPDRGLRVADCSTIEAVLDERQTWPTDAPANTPSTSAARSSGGDHTIPDTSQLPGWVDPSGMAVPRENLASSRTTPYPMAALPVDAPEIDDEATTFGPPTPAGDLSLEPHTVVDEPAMVRIPRLWLIVVIGAVSIGLSWLALRSPPPETIRTVLSPVPPAARDGVEQPEPDSPSSAAPSQEIDMDIRPPDPTPSPASRTSTAAPTQREEVVVRTLEPPDPPPEQNQATFTFSGADGVRLVSSAGSFGSGIISPGTYEIQARFGAREVSAGTVRVTEGEHLELACDADFEMCGR